MQIDEVVDFGFTLFCFEILGRSGHTLSVLAAWHLYKNKKEPEEQDIVDYVYLLGWFAFCGQGSTT